MLDTDIELTQAFSDAWAKHTLSAFDVKPRIMHCTLNQRTVHIEKLMLYPVQRGTGMGATVAIRKKPTLVMDNKTFNGLVVENDLKTVRPRI